MGHVAYKFFKWVFKARLRQEFVEWRLYKEAFEHGRRAGLLTIIDKDPSYAKYLEHKVDINGFVIQTRL